MPTRTFLGLALLIVFLMVASIPQLLQPTAAGVERLAVTVGVLDKAPKARAPRDGDDAPAAARPAREELALRGRVVGANGDLRDTIELEERAAAAARTRLVQGSSRRLLPGQLEQDTAPPNAREDGMLLDADGCPLLRTGADAEELLAAPGVAARYQAKVASADDPAACATTFDERVRTAGATPGAPPLGAIVARDRAAIRRGSATAMLVKLRQIELLAEIMTDEELRTALAAAEK